MNYLFVTDVYTLGYSKDDYKSVYDSNKNPNKVMWYWCSDHYITYDKIIRKKFNAMKTRVLLNPLDEILLFIETLVGPTLLYSAKPINLSFYTKALRSIKEYEEFKTFKQLEFSKEWKAYLDKGMRVVDISLADKWAQRQEELLQHKALNKANIEMELKLDKEKELKHTQVTNERIAFYCSMTNLSNAQIFFIQEIGNITTPLHKLITKDTILSCMMLYDLYKGYTIDNDMKNLVSYKSFCKDLSTFGTIVNDKLHLNKGHCVLIIQNLIRDKDFVL